MEAVVCGVDLGSTNIKAGCVGARGAIVSLTTLPVAKVVSQGGTTFAAEGYMQVAIAAMHEAVARLPASTRVAAIAVANQRATVAPVDEAGCAIGPALSWQDIRGEPLYQQWLACFGADAFTEITGLPPNAVWTLAKLLWLRHEDPDVFARAHTFALIHDLFLRHLGVERYITDPSNASLTGLFDIRRGEWSREILAGLDLAETRVPAIAPAGAIAGALTHEVASATGLPSGLPIIVGGGDQQCAALGAGAIQSGQVTVCLGTAGVVNSPLAHPPRWAQTARLACTVHVLPGMWMLEGLHGAFGASMSAVATLLGIGAKEAMDRLAMSAPPGAHGLLFLPFLNGIVSPDFDSAVRGAFIGLDLAHEQSDVMRAVMEGNCFELRRLLDAIAEQTPISSLTLVCGGAKHGALGQLLADVTGYTFEVSEATETTLLGAAILAWTGIGRFATLQEGAEAFHSPVISALRPQWPPALRDAQYARYQHWVRVVREGTHACTPESEVQ